MLREYQEQGIEKLREALRGGSKRPLMVMPTGAGKSIVFGQIISSVVEKGKRVLWIVHRRNLVKQMQDVLKTHFDVDAGIIMSGIESDLEKPVQLCTIQTLARRRELERETWNPFCVDADVVLIDEAHRAVAKQYSDVIEAYGDKIIMGCTATPARADGRGLGEVFDHLVDIAGVVELTEQGYLAPARYFAPVEVDLSGVRTAMGDYMIKDLEGKMIHTKLIGDVVENWLRLAEGRKTIVYGVNVKHSKALCQEFNRHGIAAEHLDARSSDDERDRVFKRMENGDITVICNVALYQEGLDVPDVSAIVMARPTKSLGLYRQCCGRGLRPSPGKRDTLILDHGNVIETHGLLDWPIEWTLDGKERAWKKPSRRVTEKLMTCRVCHEVFMGAAVCPVCGTPVKSFGKKIETVEADLEEIGKKEKFSMGDKRQWYGMFLSHARRKGYSEGWASHKYREKFDVWPNKLKDTSPIEPNDEFRNYIRYLNIRYAKSKQKQKTDDFLKRGEELAKEYHQNMVDVDGHI